MRILLDTHYLIWSMYDTSRLDTELYDLLADEMTEIYYSTVSLWESEIKHIKHPNQFEFTCANIYYDAASAGYHMMGLEPHHIFSLGSLTDEGGSGHSDPFDRMLIAQARSEGMLFATHDRRLLTYNEPCVIYF